MALARPHLIVKPGRRTGGGYIADKIDSKTGLRLCDSCITKYYYNGVDKLGLKANWGYYYEADCNGCGEMDTHVILFLPQETFYEALSDNHGLAGEPRKKLFSWPWRS